MVAVLGKYVQSVSLVIIFTTFINLIMPRGDFQKYIKIILGLIIMMTIMAPINELFFRNKPSYIDFLKRYEIEIESAVAQTQSQDYLDVQNEIILDAYREKLKPQMIEIIEKSNQVEVAYIDIGFNQNTDTKEFGTITSIAITIRERQKNHSNHKIYIPKIKVATKQRENNRKSGAIEGQIEQNIKTSLIDFYNLSDANINITVQKND